MAAPNQIVPTAPDRDIATKICSAIETLFANDSALFVVDSNERSISHRLAVYLTHLFPEWDVDCEYNRDGHEPKRLQIGASGDGNGTDGSRVFPDIIVHRRRTPDNFLVIEIKKSTSVVSDEGDRAKLQRFCEQLHYRYGLFLCFASATDQPDVVAHQWWHANN